MENFKLQKLHVIWEMTWNKYKSESTGFYTRKNSKIALCDIDSSGFFDVDSDPHISSIVHFVVDRLAKLVLFVSVTEADDSPAPAP